jgi:hypothetical protein
MLSTYPPVVIPTRGRPAAMQVTAEQLLAADVPFHFARTADDTTPLRNPCGLPDLVVPARNIAEKRQRLLERYDRFVMVDDDVRFFTVDAVGRASRCTSADLRALFALIRGLLDTNALVGVEQRFMIQLKERPLNSRLGPLVHVFGINRSLLRGGERFDRVVGHEDIDFVLQVMTAGLPVAIVSEYCHSDCGNFTRPGGCSIWRTRESCLEQINVLQRLWPELITHRPDRQGIPRVRCRWQRVREMRGT